MAVILATGPGEYYVGNTEYGDLILAEKNRKCAISEAPAILTFIRHQAEKVASIGAAFGKIEEGEDSIYIPLITEFAQEDVKSG